MARLIEVDLDVVEKEFYTDLTAFYHDSYGRGFTAGLKAMLGFLKKQPTIEAEPVKHGKWKWADHQSKWRTFIWWMPIPELPEGMDGE